MDIKHIEELAKDKDLDKAYLVSSFMSFDKKFDVLENEYDIDYELDELPKNWNELTDAEKEKLVDRVWEFYIKYEFDASLSEFARIGIIFQKEILYGDIDKWWFYKKYDIYHCGD